MALAAGLLALALLAAGKAEALFRRCPSRSERGALDDRQLVIAVAGLVFSLTLVALTLAAGTAIGARACARRYLRKRTIQLTLGIFVATFVFALIVQSAVGTAEDGVPRLAVSSRCANRSVRSNTNLIFAFLLYTRTIQVGTMPSPRCRPTCGVRPPCLGGPGGARCRRASPRPAGAATRPFVDYDVLLRLAI